MKIFHPERLEGLHPLLREFVNACASRLSFDILVVQGVRSNDDQARLWAQGRSIPGRIVTNARTSAETAHGRGAAVDLAPVVNGTPMWNEPHYFTELAAVGRDFALVWGGDWPHLKDSDHWEVAGWRALPFTDPDLTPPLGTPFPLKESP